MLKPIILFTILFSLSIIHFTQGGIFRRYVRKHRPGGGYRGPFQQHPQQYLMPRARMIQTGPNLIERQFRLSRQRPWPLFLRRPRAPPQLLYHYPLQSSIMLQTPSPQPLMRSRASRRYRFFDRLDNNRVPQFHHQPVTAPIGISTTTRLPIANEVQWRPFDYGNPIDRDPLTDYAPPTVERVRFISEVRGASSGRPTARANTGMLGMYSRPSPVVVPAPWKRDPNVRARNPAAAASVMQQHPHYFPPPRGAFPLWKLLASKQRPRRPVGLIRPMQQQVVRQPPRFIGQDPNHPLYHHQVYHHDDAEVFPHIPNIVYFKPSDVSKPKKHSAVLKSTGKKPSGSGALKPGTVSNVQLYPKEVSSSSEFRPIKPSRPDNLRNHKPAHPSGNKAYQFTVVGYSGPAATTPMSPVAVVPSTAPTTNRPPTVLYAVKTTPETLSTTHNSAVKPLEPTESLEPEEDEAASELRPVHVLPDSPSVAISSTVFDDILPEVEDGREQGGVDEDFVDSVDEPESQKEQAVEQPAPVPVIPNSFNVFESLLSSFEKQFGGDDGVDGEEEEVENEEIHEVKKDNHQHHQRVPVFEPVEESTLRGVLLPAVDVTTSIPSRNNFETSTSISMSVGVSHSSSSSSSNKNKPIPTYPPVHEEPEEEEEVDGYFANIKIVPTTSTTTTTTTTTTEKPTTTSEAPTTTSKPVVINTSTAYPRLPTMPTYKRKPTPVYARKSSKVGGLLSKYSSSSSSVSKEVSATGGAVPNGSGEVVIITAGRSKVKEYKPQIIANQTNLLAFDKVVSGGGDGESGVKETPIVFSSDASPSSTTKSPLEDFDAMQLLHSWLNKA